MYKIVSILLQLCNSWKYAEHKNFRNSQQFARKFIKMFSH